MYDMNSILTFDNLLKRVEPYQIFAYYIGKDIKLNKVLNSPLRKDKKPSFSIHISKSGYMYYNDWATGEWGGAIQFVMKLLNLPNLYSALSQINSDMNLKLLDDKVSNSQIDYKGFTTHFKQEEIEKIAKNTASDIKISVRKWEINDLKYWAQFGITEQILTYYNVFPCQRVFLNKMVTYVHNTYTFKPAYAYAFYKDNEYSYKIYQPMTPDYKWTSNVDFSVLQGWDQMPESHKVLIITKSLKDVMTLRSLGIPALATQGELMGVKPHIYEQLKKRFKEIYLLFDFDYGGVKGTQKLRKLIPGLKYFFIEYDSFKGTGYKDISDFRVDHTPKECLDHLRKCLRTWNKIFKK